ncbi:MAG: phage tail tape measure protein [Romboutsia sp.]|uniref:phage tail tape measure protein n=1 Tax=Romboutsia sp. TaxID=1965302 RepID=UPI003F348836
MSEVYSASGSIEIDVSQAITAFRRIQSETKTTSSSLDGLGDTSNDVGGKFANIGSKITKFGDGITKFGKKLAPASAGLTLFGKKAIDTGVAFEDQMNRVRGVSGATANEFESLKNKALEASSQYGVGTKEVAEGMENLASAGLNTGQILDSTNSVLALSTASGEDLAGSTDILTGAMSAFNYTAKDTNKIADILVENGNKTNAGVKDTGDALKYAQSSASALGVSLPMTTAMIGELANNSIKGSTAGTALRGMFTRLSAPTKEASDAMKKIGFNAFDANGKLKSMPTVIDQLGKSLKGTTDKQKQYYLSTIFGQEAGTAMNVLLKEGGKNLNDLSKSYDNASGSADKMANTANQGVGKSLRQLKSSFEILQIKLITSLAPTLTSIANHIGKLIDKFNKLSPTTQKVVGIIGGVIAISAPLLLMVGKIISSVGHITSAIGTLAKAPSKIRKVVSSFSKFGGVLNKTKSATMSLAGKMGKLTLAILKNTGKLVKNGTMWVVQKGKMLAFKSAQLIVTGATKAMTLAQKALNLAMEMNPIGLIILALTALATVFIMLYKKCDWFRNGVNAVFGFIKKIFVGFANYVGKVFTANWGNAFKTILGFVKNMFSGISSVFGSIKRIFSGIIDFVAGVFTGDWSRAWEGVKNIFGGIMSGLGAVMKAPLNGIIGLINMAIDGINSISVTIPSWIPGIGGKHFGTNFGHISYLYDGAVFDKPTLLGNNTVVGDHYKGFGNQTEYVLPDRKLQQSVRGVVRSEISNLALVVDGEKIGHVMAKNKDRMDLEYSQLNPF